MSRELPYADELRNWNMTKYEAGKVLYGSNSTFDTALPQGWVDELLLRQGFDPVPCVVWLYRKGDALGCPAPLTYEAREKLLELYGSVVE